MRKIDQMIADARARPTARERIDAYLEISNTSEGLPGRASYLEARARLTEIRRRLAQPDVSPTVSVGGVVYPCWVDQNWQKWADEHWRIGRISGPRRECPLALHCPPEPVGAPREEWKKWTHYLREKKHKIELENRAIIEKQNRAKLLAQKYTPAVIARGGEISINGGDRSDLRATDELDGLVLLHADGYRQYSRAFGAWRASLSYLCGTDDSGDWAIRVPGTITSVEEAQDWVEPREVKLAKSKGKRVLRQGDIYAIETSRKYDGTGDLPSNHTWLGYCRFLLHGEHAPMQIPFFAKFARQRVYAMGRGRGRGFGD